jgi:hypothetical protein
VDDELLSLLHSLRRRQAIGSASASSSAGAEGEGAGSANNVEAGACGASSRKRIQVVMLGELLHCVEWWHGGSMAGVHRLGFSLV